MNSFLAFLNGRPYLSGIPTGDLVPIADNTFSIGTSALKYANIYATQFNGSNGLFGNQVTAAFFDGASSGDNTLRTLAAGKSIFLRSGNNVLAMTLDQNQICTHAAGVVFSTVNTQTAATYTVAATDNYIIANRAGTITLTLGTATNGRRLVVRTITANTVVSASSNVVPLAGGAAGTAILAATAGKWAELVGDGTNWQIQAAN